MKVLGTKLLIQPEKPDTKKVVVQKSNRGVVISVGDEIKNVSKDDLLIFSGDRASSFTLPMEDGTMGEFLLIDKEDVAIVFEKEAL